MKVLVTGGAGFIGSHIVDILSERGHRVIILDDMSSGSRENIESSDTLIVRDITEPIIDLGPFDVVCHQAAQPSLRRSIDDPAYDAMVNIIGTLNVIQAAKACGAHVVFASTSAVYADVGHPLKETGPFQPTTPYGLAKYAAERYIKLLAPSYTILRYGNVYGPRQVQVGENQLIPHCLAHLLDGEPFVINGDGEQTRDFVYVGDIARANVLAIEGRVRGVFNCGRGMPVSVRAVCEALANLCGPWMGEFAHGPAKAGEARHISLDPAYTGARLGWWAEANLTDSLKATIAWWKEHRCVSV